MIEIAFKQDTKITDVNALSGFSIATNILVFLNMYNLRCYHAYAIGTARILR